jgi:hypothetical protein
MLAFPRLDLSRLRRSPFLIKPSQSILQIIIDHPRSVLFVRGVSAFLVGILLKNVGVGIQFSPSCPHLVRGKPTAGTTT